MLWTMTGSATHASGRRGLRILIVRPSALGDVARTVPALVTLRHAHPDAQIDWLVHEAYRDAVAHHPALSGTIPFPRGRFGRFWTPTMWGRLGSYCMSLRQRRYDIAIDLQGLLRSGLLTLASGAARRIGYANARELASLGYNAACPVDPKLHAVERMLSLLEASGYSPVRDMRLYVSAADQTWWLEERRQLGLAVDEPYACLAPTAKWQCKCWPLDFYRETARRLLDTGIAGRTLVLLASPAEAPQVQPLVEALGPHARILQPRTTVGRLMAILQQTSLLVCNDSAPLHLAVGLDRPTVAIFGPTDPALVGPYLRPDCVVQPDHITAGDMKHYRHRRDDQALIARVSVDQVWSRIQQTLGCGVPR